MAINIKFTAQETEVIRSLRAMGEETSKLVDQNIKLAQQYARTDAESKFFAKGLNRLKDEALSVAKANDEAARAAKRLGEEQIKAAEKAQRAAEKASAVAEREANKRREGIANGIAAAVGFQFGGPASGIGGAIGGLQGAAIGASVDGLVALGREISDVTERYNRLRIALDSATGSSEMGARAFDFIVKLASQTGQRIETLGTSYKTLAANARGTVLEGAGVERIFSAITKAGSGMQLSNDQIKGSLKAIGDMMNKGKIQAEELTQQFSENFPGGAKIFAEALGISTSALFKLGEEGKLVATEVLPKVADYLEKTSKGDYAKNLNTITGSMNLLRNELDLLMVSFGQNTEINTFFANINNGLAGAAKGVREFVNSKSWKEFIGVLLQKGGFVPIIGETLKLAGQGLQVTGEVERISNNKVGLTGFSKLNETQREQKIFQKAEEISGLKTFVASRIQAKRFDEEFYKAKDRLEKAEKLLVEMQAADKKLSPQFNPKTAIPNPTGLTDKEKQKKESAFEKQIRKENEAGKDLFRERLAIIKAASAEAELLMMNPQAPSKLYGKGVADIDTGFGVTKSFQKENWEKMLPDVGYMSQILASRLTSFQQVINKETDKLEWRVVFDPEKFKMPPTGFVKDKLSDMISEAEGVRLLMVEAVEGMAGSLGNSFAAFGEALAGGENPFKAFGEQMINALSSTLISIGSQLLIAAAMFAAFGAATLGITSANAVTFAVAGGAMTALGGAMKAVKFADGGIVSGRTFAEVGEYRGARNNPEVIAPLNKLGAIFTPYFQRAVNMGQVNQPQLRTQAVNTTTNVYMDGKIFLQQLDRTILRQGRI